MTLEYQDRYVAFIDIIGFEDLIDRTIGTPPIVKLEDIISALDVPSEVQLEGIVLGRIGDLSSASHTLTTFSDCIAVSTEGSEKGLMNLLFHVRAIAFRMLRLRYLVRGGIARGNLYHHEGKIIEPAITKEALEAEPPINDNIRDSDYLFVST